MPRYMKDPTIVKELARAVEVVAKVRDGSATHKTELRKGCGKVEKMLNGMIVEMLKGDADG